MERPGKGVGIEAGDIVLEIGVERNRMRNCGREDQGADNDWIVKKYKSNVKIKVFDSYDFILFYILFKLQISWYFSKVQELGSSDPELLGSEPTQRHTICPGHRNSLLKSSSDEIIGIFDMGV